MVAAAVAVTVVATVVVCGLLGAPPAAADVDAVSARAFGLLVRSELLDVAIPEVPAGINGVAAEPVDSFGPLTGLADPAGIPQVLRVGSVGATVEGARVVGEDHLGSASARASVDGLVLGSNLVTVAAVTSSCTANGDGSTGAVVLENLVLGNRSVAAPAPNTRVEVPNVLTAVLNEQVVTNRRGSTSIVVRAAHLLVLPGVLGEAVADVVVAESRCSATGPDVLTADGPDGPDDGRPPSAPTARFTPTTRPGPAMTTALSGPTSTTSSTTTPGAGATTTSVPAPPPTHNEEPTLTVLTRRGKPSGPRGAEVDVSGRGYQGCDSVYLLLDGVRIGSDVPRRPNGALRARGLSVPGDADIGDQALTASCHASGDPVLQSAPFEVVESTAHRSAFVTAVPQPRQVRLTPTAAARTTLTTLMLFLFVAFPSKLFNNTLDENYNEVRAWFGLKPKRETVPARNQWLPFAAFIGLGGILYAFLSPGFGFDRSSLALVLGLSIGLALVSVGFAIPTLFHVHGRYGEWAKLRILPGTAVVALVCVVLSRLVHFQPGYLYGLIAGLAFRRRLDNDTAGRLTAFSAVLLLGVSLGAWLARAPVSAAAAQPDAGFWLLTLEACLAVVFVLGLESLVLGLLPMRFVEGSRLEQWNRPIWAVLFGLGLLSFVHVLLTPTSGYVADTSRLSSFLVVGLFVLFGVVSITFWAYFRLRAPPAA